MKQIELKINNIPVTVDEGTTILEAARKVGIHIPTLCYLKEINAIGACRVCVVEIKGARNLGAACVYPVAQGMEVFTNTEKVLQSRKMTVELILSDHEQNCLSCVRSGNCELQTLSHELGCNSKRFDGGATNKFEKDCSTEWLVRDNNKCITCRRCVAVCDKLQDVGVIGANDRGFKTHIGCAFDSPLAQNPCVACGQCINICPVGALTEKDDTDQVFAALSDPKKHVIVGTAPSVRVGLGEEFGVPMGNNVEGQMVAALRRLGFDRVFDVNVTADLTILEEGTELLGRLNNKGTLPMITSCSPGWIRYIELYYPELLAHLSSCKSPQQMFGAICKTYYAEKFNIDPKDIFVVSIMPCTAKKFEHTRDHQSAAGVKDVDVALTTRELAKMIKKAGIMFDRLPNEQFDTPFGIASGAGLIFGTTGGVMEAALRTVYEVVTGKTLANLDFTAVRGIQGIKEATVQVGDIPVKVAVASGIANARKLLDKIKNGEADYHFIEIMTCPGGCVNGGGNPIQPADVHNFENIREARAKAIYDTDKAMTLRKSHESPVVKALYAEYFEKPNSHKAHHILHTEYTKREKFPK